MKNTKTYHELVQKMRTFFVNKNFIEVPSQSRLSILAACENPHSVKTFEYGGEIWPLPQTGQMWLELELLNNPEWDGVFCISTSYREEKNPIPGRHELIFPMFEFESKGTMEDLVALGLWDNDMKEDIMRANGSIQHITKIPADLRELRRAIASIDKGILGFIDFNNQP